MLTDRQKVRIYLENIGLKTNKEIGEWLGIGENAVNRQLRPGREEKLSTWCRAIIKVVENYEKINI